ncbi:MAG: hypothetical protein RBS05_12460 [Zoogloea oleivorans]|jgi:hypothetical protein|uniref:hypothetical protein n=1 Tax=Zoogloea oleivorans TaxID=1552750 RepID=UPI002A3698B5|nr:hypothetical protein [Zoogloea oleivorans]MDY0036713.1 hypothetical protein [Zoogloea oleivorans]
MAILNLTQHPASGEQIAAGVIDLPGSARATLIELLTVEQLPSREEIAERCADIAQLAALNAANEDREDGRGFATSAMIGGAPWMMAALEAALQSQGFEVLYAFSVRESVEQAQPDGSVRKVNVFRHAGFVQA